MKAFRHRVCLLLEALLLQDGLSSVKVQGEVWEFQYPSASLPIGGKAYIYRAIRAGSLVMHDPSREHEWLPRLHEWCGRDVPDQRLVMFAEVLEDDVSNVTHCAVHPHGQSDFSLPAVVTRLPHQFFGHTRTSEGRMYAIAEYIPIRIDCVMHQDVMHATAGLIAGGELLLGLCDITDVHAVHLGRIAACVGPLVSGSLSSEWVQYHKQLGVEMFFNFVPSGMDFIIGKYNADGRVPKHVLEYLHAYGAIKPDAISLEPQTKVENLLYAPPSTSYYFGQVAMMHACWYSQRYAFDFVLAVDADEYIWMNASLPHQPNALAAWLAQNVPVNAASVSFPRYTYPLACQSDDKHHPAQVKYRTAHPQGLPKLIVRPMDIQRSTVHFTCDVTKGMNDKFDAAPEVFIKHIRDYGQYYKFESCDTLVQDSNV